MRSLLPSLGRRQALDRAIGAFAIACALLAFCIAAFSRLALGDFCALDRSILEVVRHAVDRQGVLWTALRRAMLLATTLGAFPTLTAVTLIVAALLFFRRRGARAARVMLCAGMGVATANLMKDAFGRARPDVVPHWIEVSSLSFPSGHSADASIVYLLVTMLALEGIQCRAARAVLVTGAFLLVGLIGFSRVYLGVHWPTDVLAGWTLGAGWAYFAAPIVLKRGSPFRS